VAADRIGLRPAAVRTLRNPDPAVRPRVQGAIGLLADEPRPPASSPLRGRPGYRVRVGDHCISSANANANANADDVVVVVVVVVALGHRREVDAG